MNARVGNVGPLEIAVAWVAGTAIGVIGVVWGSGLLIGSILGSTLPAGTAGIQAILQHFPRLGDAWAPTIPTAAVIGASVAVAALFAPLLYRLMKRLRLNERGASWATTSDLRRSRLLIADRPIPSSVIESGVDHE